MNNIEEMYSEEVIKDRINTLAQEINEYYNGKEIFVICILKGAMIFTSDLIRNLTMPLELDFIKASSYKEKTYSEGNVDIQGLLDIDIKDKNVLIIDDIIDTGYTLNEIISQIENKGAKSVKLCTLFNKSERRKIEVDVDFYGFDIPNEFIVGYGLDIDQKYRNLPYIGKVKQLKKDKD